MGCPKISIVTPVRNSVKYIEETILSVVSQGYPNLEYIVVDGGSTDGTIDIIKKYEKHFSFWISEPDNGQFDALNKGFKKSSGEIMGWLCASDILLPKSLFTIAEIFTEFPNVEWITGMRSTINEQGIIIDFLFSQLVLIFHLIQLIGEEVFGTKPVDLTRI